MPRQVSERLTSKFRWLIPLMLSVALVVSTLPAVGTARAQDEEGGDTLVSTQFDTIVPAPAFVRLLRITMGPGSSVPVRSHPGPKIDLVESGTLTVHVREGEQPTTIQVGDEDAAEAPIGEDFELAAGDVITLPANTIYQFRNESDEPVVLLTVVILPAGHQRPPGISYPDGDPAPDAYAGITNQVLGDGVATALPAGPVTIEISRVEANPETPVPSFAGPVLLSLVEPEVDAVVDAGLVQVSRTIAPGPQRESEIGASYTLMPGDAFFFPYGNAELEIADGVESVSFLSLTITPADENAEITGTPAPEDVELGAVTISPSTGQNETRVLRGTPRAQLQQTPEAEDEGPGEEPTDAEATEEPVEPAEATEETDEAPADAIAIGTTVATTDAGVNIRSEPSASGEVVATIEEAGTQFVIIGPPVEADDYTWYPVQGLDDPSISGWVASDFIEIV